MENTLLHPQHRDTVKSSLSVQAVPISPATMGIKSLLSELTLEEKVSLLSGVDFRTTPGVPRLDIVRLASSDGINGVRPAAHDSDMTTACFPNTTCLAATWDAELLGVMGERLVLEAFAKSSQFLLGPTINIHRDPRGGRNFECFSEDPLLSGQLAGAIVNSVQKAGVGSVAKHLVCNDSEFLRHFYNVEMSLNDRPLREIYLAAWQHLLRTSDPVGLMMAYNKVDGEFCSENKPLMDLVRNEWGYKGIFMSDWFGTHNTVAPIKAGLDLEMPFPVWRNGRLVAAVKSGQVSMKEIDARVTKMLEVRERTKPSHRDEPEYSERNKETIKVIRDLAAGGIVLMKNENAVLPIKSQKIALIGEFAENPVVTGGGSASCNPQYRISPHATLRVAFGETVDVQYAPGVRTRRVIPMASKDILQAGSGQPGVDVKYFNDGTSEPIIVEHLEKAAVWMLGDYRRGLKAVGSHLEMTTKLTSPSTGKHILAVRATGDFSLLVDGKEVLTGKQPDVTTEQTIFNHTLLEFRSEVELNARQSYDIKLNMRSRDKVTVNEPTPYAVTFCFEEYCSEADAIAEAVKLAKKSDTSVIFAGRDGQYESEGFDLESIKMPANQAALIQAVAAASKQTILVLQSGSPIDVSDFVDDIDAILAAHFYGQEGPNAIADILAGKVNPSGKLATTWFKSLEDSPTFSHFPAVKEADGSVTLKYAEGLQMGYRHPDASRVRYPFGHGLSYTTFDYSDLQTKVEESSSTSSKVTCSVKVSNTGPVAGREVIQLYVTPAATTSVWRPQKELKGFTKILLRPGESKKVTLEVDLKVACSYWDEEKRAWSLESGDYGVLVGNLSDKFSVAQSEVWNHL
ncbi:thermostable beta-glucosidase B [Seiridium cupressi]